MLLAACVCQMHLLRLHPACSAAHTTHDALRYDGPSYMIPIWIANLQDVVLTLNVLASEAVFNTLCMSFLPEARGYVSRPGRHCQVRKSLERKKF